jgi:hypothetical protein
VHRIVVGLLAVALVLAGCGTSPPRVGADGGPLDTVTTAPTDPAAPSDPSSPGTDPGAADPTPSSPADPTGPSDQQSAPSSPPPSGEPSDQPSGDPSDEPTEQVPPADLELDGWDVRIVGIIDPARANVLNVFRARPVVVVFHAQADPAPAPPPGAATDQRADAAAIVDAVAVDLRLETGQLVDQLHSFTGHTTVECPAQVEYRVVLRAGQGQRLCAVFDVPATGELGAVELFADGTEAIVDRADVADIDTITARGVLDVGVPEGMLDLGEVVDVVVDAGTATATIGMAVTGVELLDEQDDRLVGVTVELSSAEGVGAVRLDPEAVAAIAPDGTQRVRVQDVATSDCRGPGRVDVPAEEVVSVCVPILLPADTITSHARFTRNDGPPHVWRVLDVGGTAGPGSNA